tara:strand:+ start:135 stop:1820 length:1686 start_codon:yes stop_codon:yes gene_type:complete
MKVWVYAFLITFSTASFAKNEDCQGMVYEFSFSTDYFHGLCENGLPVWGEWYYSGEWKGDYYIGFFDDNGNRWKGTYHFLDGDYVTGESFQEMKSKNDLEYNFFGRYQFKNGNSQIGYMIDTNPSGFGVYLFEEDPSELVRKSEIGVFSHTSDKRAMLNGYGARETESGTYIGFWIKGAIANGDYYFEDNNGNVSRYKRSGEYSYGPYSLNSSDLSRYNNITDFLESGLEDLTNRMALVDEYIDDYSYISETYIAENNYSDQDILENKNSVYGTQLVTSTQELLNDLGYSVGEVDGILGDKTIAAIKAFELEMQLEELTGAPSEELLIALQLAIRAQNKSIAQLPDQEPVLISTGTGFYINDKNIISNHHVIKNCVYLTDSKEENLNLLVADVVNDLALLEGPKKTNSISISPNPPELGEKIYVSGYPYNSDLKSFMITSGNVSSLTGLGKNFTNFSHTAPSQPGNSGGPIVNEYGSLVGILVGGIASADALSVDLESGEVEGILPQNINFGIKNTVLKSLLSDNDIKASIRDPYFTKSEKSIAEISKNASVLIKCYGFYE